MSNYNIGDVVYFFGEKKGIITNIFPGGGADKNHSDLYEVVFDGEDKPHQIVETLLESSPSPSMDVIEKCSNNDNIHTLHENIANKLSQINNKIREIFNELSITPTDDLSEQKKNAFRLFEYIIEHSSYDDSIMQEKETSEYETMCELEIEDIHRTLCNHKSVCSSDSAALSLLFRRAGISSNHITIAEKGPIPMGIHEVVRIQFGDEYYFCDPTLVRSALKDGDIPEVRPNIFAFTPDDFFNKLYPTKEIKYEHYVPNELN